MLFRSVFSQVWGDYTKERAAFDQAADESYSAGKTLIDEQRAKKCAFLVCVLSEGELSELTHAMNLWKSKEERILQGEYQVDLDEKDFNEKDARMISTLDQMYPIGLIEDSSIVNIDSRYFIFHKKDISRLIEQHFDTLSSLTENEQLCNPVFVEVDERGCLLID